MITVNLQSGGTYSIAEEAIAYVKNNTSGSEVVIVEGNQPRSIFSSQSPSVVAALSPYILSLTNIENAKVQATINYTGLNGTIDFTFFIGAGRWSKLTDNGSALTALAQNPQNIAANQSITSSSGFATVSSASYSYPTNVLYLNALRIKDVTALGVYGGSLAKYDDAGAELAEYELGIAPATLVSLINALSTSSSVYQVTLTNNGTDTYGDADIDFSVPSGLTSIVGKNLLLAFIANTMENVAVTSPVLPATIGANIVFVAPPSGDITLIVS